ncbi:MAG: DNA-binding protein [Ruminococcus sp.]|nr:DNA-binding protein [Ruminococcus sp.]
MEKNLVYTELLDIYKGLLTDKQAETMEYYYDSDYSLGEISELMSISRQGVRDFIKRGEAIIDEMESKLNLLDAFRTLNEIATIAEELKKTNKRLSNSREITALAEEIVKKVKYIENGAE